MMVFNACWKVVRVFALIACWNSFSGMASVVWSQSTTMQSATAAPNAAQSRMRPLGAASAVDRYRAPASPVRQVAMMQQSGDGSFVAPPSLPPSSFVIPPSGSTIAPPPSSNFTVPPNSGFAPPPSNSLPAPFQSAPVTPVAPPRQPPTPPAAVIPRQPALPPQTSLPTNPNVFAPGPTSTVPQTRTVVPTNPGLPARPNDYQSIAPPQLNNAFATIDNCRNISGPSTYRAGSFGCGAPATYAGPIYAPAAYNPPPSQFAPGVALPPGVGFPTNLSGSLPAVIPGNPGFRPLISFGQENNPVQVGQGIFGQPVAYVPGQSLRNALRYIAF